jgi:hypothetical protein
VKRFMTVAVMALVIAMTSAVAEPSNTPQTLPQAKQQPLKTIPKKAGKAAKTKGAKAGPGKACHDC